MELKDTTELMNSANYKERFTAEYWQTKIRYEKLKTFCDRIEAAERLGVEAPKHDCPLNLLREQQHVMGEYLHLLEVRAQIERVNLKVFEYAKPNIDGGATELLNAIKSSEKTTKEE